VAQLVDRPLHRLALGQQLITLELPLDLAVLFLARELGDLERPVSICFASCSRLALRGGHRHSRSGVIICATVGATSYECVHPRAPGILEARSERIIGEQRRGVNGI
jgi:hypothetical protein